MNISKLLSLIDGVPRTVDFFNSSNTLTLAGGLDLSGSLELNGSTSGYVILNASATTSTYTLTMPPAQATSAGYVLTNDGTGTLSWSNPSSGSVNSVALSLPSIFNVSGSPVTSSGTLTATLANEAANSVWAGPTSGSAAAPTFRVLVSADIPNNSANTTGTASNVTATSNATLATLSALSLPVTQLTGTLQASQFPALTGDVITTAGSLATSLVATSNATLATLSALTAASSLASVGTITSGTWAGTTIAIAHGGTGQTTAASAYNALSPMTTTGDIEYEASANTAARLPIGTTGQVLTVVSGLPAWSSPATSGTVTSVAFADASTDPIYSITGSPVTSSGTLTHTLATQTANTVFAGPLSGSAAQPSFRALVSADIPSLSAFYLPLSGGTMSGAINMGSHQINALSTPTLSTDAATKGYVDAAITGLSWEGPAKVYAASNVPLTGAGTLTIDGYSVQNGDLVILGNQTTTSQNGEYTASGIGTAYVLTSNGLPSAAGQAWLILNGTVYKDSAFVANSAFPSATFTEFAGPTAYTFTAPLSLTGSTVSITQATTSTNGYLSSADWNTFNNKQAAGNYITALTGDIIASGPGSATATLATVNSNVGTFASVTVNGKGLVTAASVLSGDATTSGSVITLATVATAGTTGSSTSIPSVTINAKGLVTSVIGNAVIAPAGTLSGTALNSTVVSSSLTSVGTIATGVWNGTAIGPTYGGTGIVTYSTGDTLYGSATNVLSKLSIGSTGQVLTVAGGVPTWATPATNGTVTSVSVVSANGLAGTVTTSTTTPAITLSTTITGILQGNGTAISAASTTGSDAVVLATSPTLVTPALGTPSAAVLTNATGLPLTTGVTGTLPVANGGTGGTTQATALSALGIRSGSQAISTSSTSQAVTFSSTLGSTSYSVTCTILNTTDSNPMYQPVTVTALSATGFTASWNGPTETANYVLHYQAIINV